MAIKSRPRDPFFAHYGHPAYIDPGTPGTRFLEAASMVETGMWERFDNDEPVNPDCGCLYTLAFHGKQGGYFTSEYIYQAMVKLGHIVPPPITVLNTYLERRQAIFAWNDGPSSTPALVIEILLLAHDLYQADFSQED